MNLFHPFESFHDVKYDESSGFRHFLSTNRRKHSLRGQLPGWGGRTWVGVPIEIAAQINYHSNRIIDRFVEQGVLVRASSYRRHVSTVFVYARVYVPFYSRVYSVRTLLRKRIASRSAGRIYGYSVLVRLIAGRYSTNRGTRDEGVTLFGGGCAPVALSETFAILRGGKRNVET